MLNNPPPVRGLASITRVWTGTAGNPVDQDVIRVGARQRVFFSVLGEAIGQVVLGIYVDGNLVATRSFMVDQGDLRNDDDVYSFEWPKQPNPAGRYGSHTLVFKIGPANTQYEDQRDLPKEWTFISEPYKVIVPEPD